VTVGLAERAIAALAGVGLLVAFGGSVAVAIADAADGETSASAPEDALAHHDFVLHCAGCHRLDGSGSEHVPSLVGIGRYLEIPGGREYVARVPGVAQAPLSDERLARLVNHVFSAFAHRAVDPPYSATEVATLRARPHLDPLGVRRALLDGEADGLSESARADR
jgi:mono/diheme cytochrome c family protein